ncbi:MAG: hypothetical protein ACI4RD_03135 [Kiritimatiellia bacterium]
MDISVYGQENALDDFPVLKAFQQYIDAEHAKSRKRMLLLCIFFGGLMAVVIAVFVGMLFSVSARNQSLNDRLIEYAMSRDRTASGGSPVVVQPSQDSAAILALTAKLDDLQQRLSAEQAKAEKAAAAQQAAIEAARPKEPTPAELEVQRLKALLAAEREQHSLEKERKRQAELEAYRRKHYPELYAPTRTEPSRAAAPAPAVADADLDREIDDLVADITAKTYFDEDAEAAERKQPSGKSAPPPARKAEPPSRKPVSSAQPPEPPAATEAPAAEAEKEYSIPVDVKGSSIRWSIPEA